MRCSAKPKRHDDLALERQRDLAAVLIIANLAIGAVCALIVQRFDRDLEITPLHRTICIAVFAISFAALLVAAGLVEWLPRIAPSLRREGGGDDRPSRLSAYIAQRRMYPYYAGLLANLIAIALLTAFTGGLAKSPFLPLFVALVLIGQQVSRFKLQAGVLLVIAVAVVLGMFSYESLSSSESPDRLALAAVLLSFFAGALLNLYEKPHNHLVPKRVRAPTHARIYSDGRGIWRFSIYGQDPVLTGPPRPPVDPRGSTEFPSELCNRFDRHIAEMGAFADWRGIEPVWPAECKGSFVVPLRRRAPVVSKFLDGPIPIAFAHRGGKLGEEENSLAAFAEAEKLGYTYIETDIRTTKDGVPLIFHDPDLTRMTGRSDRVEDLCADEISRITLLKGAKIPTLAETLQAFPGLKFNIDLKDAASIEPAAWLLADLDALDRVCVTSFSERRVAAVRRLLGAGACTGLGVAGMFRVGLTSMLPGGGGTRGAAVLQIPYRWHGIKLATPAVIRRAHRIGLAVHVWTINDSTEMEAALDAGVDGVMTDELELLKDILVKRNLWQGM